jgi:hypothetical protein
MRITDITDEEIINLIGADPAAASGKAGQDRELVRQQMAEENESVIAEFRNLQACILLPYFLHCAFLTQFAVSRAMHHTVWWNFTGIDTPHSHALRK